MGFSLVQGYKKIDKELVAPDLRGKIESWVNEIAQGK